LNWVNRSRTLDVLIVPLAIVMAVCVGLDARAINLSLSPADMERALATARATWLSSDQDRARFHDAYIFRLTGVTVDYVVIDRIEVITEFRRLEVIGEAHARLNDNFGRAGLRDAHQALRSWRGRVAIVVHMQFRPTTRYITGVPSIEVSIGDRDRLLPIQTRSDGIYNSSDFGSALVGGTVEALFDAHAVGQGRRPVVLRWNDLELVRQPVDFGSLE
jgi:hypothetical protein